MAYAVYLKRSAEKELVRLPPKVHDRIVERILSLQNNPRPRGAKKLMALEAYRIRVGNYRILYTVDDTNKKIEIISVGHRQEVYGQK